MESLGDDHIRVFDFLGEKRVNAVADGKAAEADSELYLEAFASKAMPNENRHANRNLIRVTWVKRGWALA